MFKDLNTSGHRELNNFMFKGLSFRKILGGKKGGGEC